MSNYLERPSVLHMFREGPGPLNEGPTQLKKKKTCTNYELMESYREDRGSIESQRSFYDILTRRQHEWKKRTISEWSCFQTQSLVRRYSCNSLCEKCLETCSHIHVDNRMTSTGTIPPEGFASFSHNKMREYLKISVPGTLKINDFFALFRMQTDSKEEASWCKHPPTRV